MLYDLVAYYFHLIWLTGYLPKILTMWHFHFYCNCLLRPIYVFKYSCRILLVWRVMKCDIFLPFQTYTVYILHALRSLHVVAIQTLFETIRSHECMVGYSIRNRVKETAGMEFAWISEPPYRAHFDVWVDIFISTYLDWVCNKNNVCMHSVVSARFAAVSPTWYAVFSDCENRLVREGKWLMLRK